MLRFKMVRVSNTSPRIVTIITSLLESDPKIFTLIMRVSRILERKLITMERSAVLRVLGFQF